MAAVVGRAWSCARGRSCVVGRGRARSCVRGQSCVVVRGRAPLVIRGRAWSCAVGRARSVVRGRARSVVPFCPLRGQHCRDTNERRKEGTNEQHIITP